MSTAWQRRRRTGIGEFWDQRMTVAAFVLWCQDWSATLAPLKHSLDISVVAPQADSICRGR
jgi:hypothetical protein